MQDRQYYTGVGSRETPDDIQNRMQSLAAYAEQRNFVLRSGAARGADQAFERGVRSISMMQIFIPWRTFSVGDHHIYEYQSPEIKRRAFALAERFHPNWKVCSDGARALHARNVCQVLGPRLDLPSRFLVCWTKDARGGGGTGQALRIAKELGISVFDLGVRRSRLELMCDTIREVFSYDWAGSAEPNDDLL